MDFIEGLPKGAKILDVFRVSILKPFVGDPPTAPPPLLGVYHDRVSHLPAQVLRVCKARDQWQVLVQWNDMTSAEASWEDLNQFSTSILLFRSRTSYLLGRGEMLCGDLRIHDTDQRRRLLDVIRQTETLRQIGQPNKKMIRKLHRRDTLVFTVSKSLIELRVGYKMYN